MEQAQGGVSEEQREVEASGLSCVDPRSLHPTSPQPEPHNAALQKPTAQSHPSPGALTGEDPQRLLKEEVADGQAGQPLGQLGVAWGQQMASAL